MLYHLKSSIFKILSSKTTKYHQNEQKNKNYKIFLSKCYHQIPIATPTNK